MKKLRIQFTVFFLLLQVGILFLLLNSYRQMRIEEKSLWESESTKVYNQAQAQISELLNREDAKSFKDYRFVSSRNDLSESDFPKGWLGYFQVDADGKFSTPYLPLLKEEANQLSDYSLRLKKQEEIEKNSSSFRKEMKGAFAERAVSNKPKKILPETTHSVSESFEKKDAENFKSSANIYPNPIQSKKMQENKIQYAPQDSNFEQAPAEGGFAGVQLAPRREAVSLDRKNEVKKKVLSAPKTLFSPAPNPSSTLVWLDPFQAKVFGSSLIFFRRVWLQEKMILQGFILQTQPYFSALMQSSFENSDLPRFSWVQWCWEDQVIAQYAAVQSSVQKQQLLFLRDMAYPLNSMQWKILGEAWPQISTRFYLNIFSGGLFLFATLGLFWIYRSSAAHIRLSQKRQDFVAAVSHELKTPLTSIRMYSEMLEDGWVQDESKKKEYYKNIHQESERLSRLIENVLQMARLEKQSYHLNLVRQNPLQDLQEWEKQFKEFASREGFSFDLKIENEIPDIEYDPEALKEVLLILLENSIKFSRSSAQKNMSLIVKSSESFVYLIWKDQGPGVPSKELSQIFEKFYRVENELTRKTKGTGIGLAIAQSTVQAMGAKIEAKNVEGGGLEIVLRFLKT